MIYIYYIFKLRKASLVQNTVEIDANVVAKKETEISSWVFNISKRLPSP